jgi:hypothetical protein
MNKYAAKLTASNENDYLRERARLERLQARLRETIQQLSFTKAGARRKRIDNEALAEARSRKWHVDKAIRDLDAWWASKKRKAKAPKKKPAGEKPRTSKVSTKKAQLREMERLRRENEELRRREQERKEERKLERERRSEEREEALRSEFILSGDYQGLAELEGISDSEAYTEILYAQMEMGSAGVAA